jgi:PAB1-binding protein PBP1
VAHIYNPSYLGGKDQENQIRSQPRQIAQKITNPKTAGRVTQVAELLPSKPKALSSNPKKKKKQNFYLQHKKDGRKCCSSNSFG